MKKGGLNSTEDAKALVRDAPRLFVGQGRRFAWADLAAATGDNEGTLRSYVRDEPPLMPLDVMLRVFAVLPPEAFAPVARAMGLTVAALDVDDTATVRLGVAKAARLVADATEALADGRITHVERAQLGQAAADLMPTLAALAKGEVGH